MTKGPLSGEHLMEQRGSWEETLLYYHSLCVTPRSIWTAVRAIIIACSGLLMKVG